MFLDDRLLGPLGFAGRILGIIFTVNAVVICILVLVSIPLYFFARDVQGDAGRFGVLDTNPAIGVPDTIYREAAENVFASDPKR